MPLSSNPLPSTPLGSFEDSAVRWTTWVTLMGFVGVTALSLLCAGPAARRVNAGALTAVTRRLARASVVIGVLAVPAVFVAMARSEAGKKSGYRYTAAWDSLYDGSTAGLLAGLELTLLLVGIAALVPLTFRALAGAAAGRWLLVAALCAGAVALGTTRFPETPRGNLGRTSFETVVWMMHLIGGAVWLGGVAGLALLAAPGAIGRADARAFWSPTIRRFSAVAMGCVAAVTLSGVFLYWEHVDGPSQLFTTMYGRVLGVKILIFGALLVLGVVNQFWLHPRIDALRAAGDERPLRTILMRRFPIVVGVETLLAMALLFVAPFLHGSARNQAYQADVARHATAPIGTLPKLPTKEVTASTWMLGALETLVVIAVMVVGYWISGRIARRRRQQNAAGWAR